MERLRGWGLLLAIAFPLLLWFSWWQLGAQSSHVSLEQYKEWASRGAHGFAPLSEFYIKHKRPAGRDDVTMPAPPPKSGVKSWAIQADTTVLVELDAKIDGSPVQLVYVPIVRSPQGVHYDCISETSPVYTHQFCSAVYIKSSADIPTQLAENAQVITTFSDVVSASGAVLSTGTSVGSVVVVSAEPSELDHCGYQCVKVENCMSSRALACSKMIVDGNSRWYEIVSSGAPVRAGNFATRTAADQACEQALGMGYQVLNATSIMGRIKLDGSAQYWVHDEMRPRNNCWESDYRQ